MSGAAPEQTPEQIAAALDSFLAEFPNAVVAEDGKVLFDLREARYSLSTEHGRCTLHLWGDERNLVRRVSAATLRARNLRLTTHRFGQARPQSLDLLGEKDRRSPSTRETTRVRYVKVLERALARTFPQAKPEAFRTAMDLEKSFGPAYARGLLVEGNKAWAVIGVNDEESAATIDGILTFGILWLEACREQVGSRRVLPGLKVVLPRGCAALTLARLAWLAGERDQWELWELSQDDETLTLCDPADQGNISSHLVHAPDVSRAKERFAGCAQRVLTLVPEGARGLVEQRLRSGSELAFLLHGLEFARFRSGVAAESFNRMEQISFGAGANETLLTEANADLLRELVAKLCERRTAGGDKRDVLYRMQPERWLEGQLRRDLGLIDERLSPGHVYAQVPAFAAGDRGMLDLLAVAEDGRLSVIEVKADEDPQLALQGLDYWLRVRWHHAQHPDRSTGLGEFQRHGYFGALHLAEASPRLYLVAPALRIHPATEVVLRHLSARVEWHLIAVNERWREQVKVVWRKRWNDPRT